MSALHVDRLAIATSRRCGGLSIGTTVVTTHAFPEHAR